MSVAQSVKHCPAHVVYVDIADIRDAFELETEAEMNQFRAGDYVALTFHRGQINACLHQATSLEKLIEMIRNDVNNDGEDPAIARIIEV